MEAGNLHSLRIQSSEDCLSSQQLFISVVVGLELEITLTFVTSVSRLMKLTDIS